RFRFLPAPRRLGSWLAILPQRLFAGARLGLCAGGVSGPARRGRDLAQEAAEAPPLRRPAWRGALPAKKTGLAFEPARSRLIKPRRRPRGCDRRAWRGRAPGRRGAAAPRRNRPSLPN